MTIFFCLNVQTKKKRKRQTHTTNIHTHKKKVKRHVSISATTTILPIMFLCRRVTEIQLVEKKNYNENARKNEQKTLFYLVQKDVAYYTVLVTYH